ncbi:hypothetical protein FRC08_016593, partial [Ceratobasidium sp. 394]
MHPVIYAALQSFDELRASDDHLSDSVSLRRRPPPSSHPPQAFLNTNARTHLPIPYHITNNMISVLAGIRYALFALYIIYSGVLVTAGAWHLGLANTIGASAQLDAFVVFLGAFGLLFILAVTFIDTLRKHAVTSTVWFELAWLGLFWVFYLAAASAATAIGPSTFCGIQGVDILGWRDACAAIKVIIAFTWIGTFTFLVHMFTLL